MASRITRSRKQATQQQEQQQTRAKWTTLLTKVLVDLMVDQVHKGNRNKNSFSTKAWKNICDDFYLKTGLRWDKEQLKNRFAVLRRQYAIVKSLLDRNDFSWDESTGSVIASDEAWAEYIQEHADAETVKTSGCPIYNQLCSIFSELPTTSGKHEWSVENEGGIPSSVLCPEPLRTEISSESVKVDDQDFQPATPSSITAIRKRGRKGVDGAIAGAILEMAAASKQRTADVNLCNERYTMANCIKELCEMQAVEQQVYLAALDLFVNANARETFLSLQGDKRLIWLLRKCTASSIAL